MKEENVSKLLRCDSLVPGCEYEARGTEEEILAAAGRHAAEDHGIEVTPELVEKVKGAIRRE
jgi:predicted small metal-binding protein